MASKRRLVQLSHSKRRALERFNMNLSMLDIEVIVATIQNQKAKFIKRLSTRMTAWEVECKGYKLYVAYDKHTKALATVMPISYAINDIMKEAKKHLQKCDPRHMNFYEKLDKAEKGIEMAYEIFKEAMAQ